MGEKLWCKIVLLLAVIGICLGFGGADDVKADETSGFWKYTISDNTACITGYTGAEANLTIPSALGGKPVTALGYRAFSEKPWIVSVTVPNTVQTVFSYCFAGCEGLTVVYGMENALQIGAYAFFECVNLRSVSLGNVLQTIGDHAFKNCVQLNDCPLPATLTKMESWCFEHTGLVNVAIPASVELEPGVFYNCQNLTAVSVGAPIPSDAFRECHSLTTVSIGADAQI